MFTIHSECCQNKKAAQRLRSAAVRILNSAPAASSSPLHRNCYTAPVPSIVRYRSTVLDDSVPLALRQAIIDLIVVSFDLNSRLVSR
jgi:hypothetical protein